MSLPTAVLNEAGHAVTTFLKEFDKGLRYRPYGVLIAIVVFCMLAVAQYVYRAASSGSCALPSVDIVVIVSTSIAIAGTVYSILSYNTALRVETSIRGTLTDFRQFLSVVRSILDEVDHGAGYVDNMRSEGASIYADLILVLWFPCFDMTRDLNSVGPAVNQGLKRLKGKNKRVYMITSARPLAFMAKFGEEYAERARLYDAEFLRQATVDLGDRDALEWRAIVRTSRDAWIRNRHSKQNESESANILVENAVESIENLAEIICNSATNYYTVHAIENVQMMNGLVQIAWTPRRAAIIFMKPVELGGGKTVREEFSAAKAYRVSGFETQDKFMLEFIRDIVNLRYGDSVPDLLGDTA